MSQFVMSKTPLPFEGKGDIFVKDGNQFLCRENGTVLFNKEELGLTVEDCKQLIYVGTLDATLVFAIEKTNVLVHGAEYRKHLLILDLLNTEVRKAVLRGSQLLNWDKNSHHCGCCGGEMILSEKEFVKKCKQNEKHQLYPQYSPSIVVLIRKDDEFLLARSPYFTQGVYSAIAGFIEPGETSEEAVKREVMEEVGVEIGNIRLMSTGPWPFPNSLMIAYQAEAVTKNLTIDPKEIEDAKWFKYNQLPRLPIQSTISYWLIQQGVEECNRIYGTRSPSLSQLHGKCGFLTQFSKNAFGIFTQNQAHITRILFSTIGQSALQVLTHQTLVNWYQKPQHTLNSKEQLALSAAAGGLVGILVCLGSGMLNLRMIAIAYEQACMALCVLGAHAQIKMRLSRNNQSDYSIVDLKTLLMTSGLYVGLSAPLRYLQQKVPANSASEAGKAVSLSARSLLFKAPIVAASAVIVESICNKFSRSNI